MPLRPTSALRFAPRLNPVCHRLGSASLRLAAAQAHQRTLSLKSPVRHLTTSSVLRASAPMAAPTDTQAAQAANESGVTPASLKASLESRLNASYVAIEDMSGGCGQAFNAVIVSSDFAGKSHLQRHRLVNNALKAEIAAIHAWTPRCLTPEQWEKEQGSVKMT